MENQKSNKGVIGILIVIIILLLLVICYLLFGNKVLNNNSGNTASTTTTTTTTTVNDSKDVTEEMQLKLNGLWYNKEQNLYFRINNGNYQSGEFATDAVIDCKIESIKLLNSSKYQLKVNNCSFDGEKRDDEISEITYNETNSEILKNGIQYKLTDENELYNN